MYLPDGHWWNVDQDAQVNLERWFFALCWGYVQMYHFKPGDDADWSEVEFWVKNDYRADKVMEMLEREFELFRGSINKFDAVRHPIQMIVWHLNKQRRDMDYEELLDVDLNDKEDFEIVTQDYGFSVLSEIWMQHCGVFGCRSLDWVYGLVESAYKNSLGRNLCWEGLEFATDVAFAFENAEGYPRQAFGRWMRIEVEKGDALWVWRDGMPIEVGYAKCWGKPVNGKRGALTLKPRASRSKSFDAIDYTVNMMRGSYNMYQSPVDVWTWDGVRWSRPSIIMGEEIWTHERQGRLGFLYDAGDTGGSGS